MKKIDARLPGSTEILMIDDDADDVRIFERSLRRADFQGTLRHFDDPQLALAYIRQLPDEQPTEFAFRIIVLDLRMPEFDGFAFLHALRHSQNNAHLPVIVFSSSDARSDVRRSYRDGANTYLTKPSTLGDYREVIRCMSDFWLTHAELPPVN